MATRAAQIQQINANQAKRVSKFRAGNKQARQLQQQPRKPNPAMRRPGTSPAMRAMRPSPIPNLPTTQTQTKTNNIPESIGKMPYEKPANDNQEYNVDQEVKPANEADADTTAQTEQENEREERRQNVNQFIQQSRIQGVLAEAAGVPRAWGDRPQPSQSEQAQKDFEKKMQERIIARGASFTTTEISNVLTVGTGGLGIILTFIPYLFTLGYLDYEIYTNQLSWDPIPMPIDKDADFLKGGVILLNILVILAGLVFLVAQLLFLLMFFAPVILIAWFGHQAVLAGFNFIKNLL